VYWSPRSKPLTSEEDVEALADAVLAKDRGFAADGDELKYATNLQQRVVRCASKEGDSSFEVLERANDRDFMNQVIRCDAGVTAFVPQPALADPPPSEQTASA
jgi:hypothetical protein